MKETHADGMTHGQPHRADLWTPAEDGAVDCFLCAHRCHVAPGRTGVCQVRRNDDGTLVTRVWGRVIARHVDPIEKKPLYHFLPGTKAYSVATVGCNFQCGFCQNWQISQFPRTAGGGAMPGEWAEPEEIVAAAKRAGCASLSYTYTEPTIFFEYARDCGTLAREQGLANTFVTNGYATPEAVEAMAGWLDAANVDLKAWHDAFYQDLCKARLEPVKETIRAMHDAGLHVEVTTLLVTGQNDTIEDLRGIAEFLAGVSPDLVWHVSRFHPDFEMTDGKATPVETVRLAVEVGRQAGLRYVYAGNVLPGQIDGTGDTVCPSCGEVVIERVGFGARRKNLRGAACGSCGTALPIIV